MGAKYGKKSWGDHPQECPECGESLKLLSMRNEGYNVGVSFIKTPLISGEPETISHYLCFVHCKNCRYQKRTLWCSEII